MKDAPYDNGVIGKHVIYTLEERQRVKIVDYTGSKKVDQSKIDEKLKEENISIRLDSFIDPSLIKKVEGVVRGLLSEKGFQFAEVTHEIKPMPGGPKLVHLSFVMDEGPKVRVREIEFEGNKAVSDKTLRKQMKSNKQEWPFSFITGRGTFQEAKFEEDAEKVNEYYRNLGYITARVGAPELKYLEDAPDGKIRYVQLKAQVQEGGRYKVGNFNFEGNKVVKSEGLRSLFKLNEGEFYSEKRIRKGLDSAREVYGAGRLLGVHRLSRPQAPRPGRSERARRREAGRPSEDGRRCADCGCDDAHAGRRAVLRQPGQLRRQYHHPRQRGAPGGPAARGWRLQHRGA